MIKPPNPIHWNPTAIGMAMSFGLIPHAPVAADPLPASTLYEIRNQVMAGMNAARSLMACMAEEYAHVKTGTCPAKPTPGAYVDRISVKKGRIDLLYGTDTRPEIAGKILSLTAYETPDNHMVWRCGNHSPPPGLKTLWNGATRYIPSTVENPYSSAACAAATAFPDMSAYRGEVIRDQVNQGLKLADPAKRLVERYAITPAHLKAAAELFNSQSGKTGVTENLYVSSIRIDPTTGVITISYNAENMGLVSEQNTLALSPYASTSGGYLALQESLLTERGMATWWACSSATQAYITGLGLAGAPFGTLPAQYAPTECR